jgi:hypothetical protein
MANALLHRVTLTTRTDSNTLLNFSMFARLLLQLLSVLVCQMPVVSTTPCRQTLYGRVKQQALGRLRTHCAQRSVRLATTLLAARSRPNVVQGWCGRHPLAPASAAQVCLLHG